MAEERSVGRLVAMARGEDKMIARKPEEVRRALIREATNIARQQYEHGTPDDINSGKRGSLVGTLNKVLDGDENRYRVLAWIFSPEEGLLSTKKLLDGEWLALWNWASFYQDDDGWHTSPEFRTEIKMMLKLLDEEKEKWNRELAELLKTRS